MLAYQIWAANSSNLCQPSYSASGPNGKLVDLIFIPQCIPQPPVMGMALTHVRAPRHVLCPMLYAPTFDLFLYISLIVFILKITHK